MLRNELKPRAENRKHVLRNETAEFILERMTGQIRGMRWLDRDVDLFQQTRGGIPGYIGHIRVYDEHDRQWFSDIEHSCVTRDPHADDRSLTVTKLFDDAQFVLTVRYEIMPEGLRWKVDAEKTSPEAADRSLRVYFDMPLIAGWDVWAPCNRGEFTFDGMTPFEFMYTQIPYVSDSEIILPMVSHYHRTLGVGYSMLEPVDANVPAAKFGFANMEKCYNWGGMDKDLRDVPVLEACNYYIGLVGDRTMSTEIMIFPHGGDWRPGVGLVYERWREFFDPFNDAIYDRDEIGRASCRERV